jgi:hypothetical protein
MVLALVDSVIVSLIAPLSYEKARVRREFFLLKPEILLLKGRERSEKEEINTLFWDSAWGNS